MTCFDEGRLLAYLDGQLSPQESREVGAHLAACPRCREVLAGLAAAREEVGRLLSPYHLAALNLPVPRPPASPRAAYAGAPKIGKGVVSWMRRYAKWIAAAAAVAIFFGYAPARGLASQFLSIFRVERVQLLHFDPADVAKLREALYANQQLNIENFGRIETDQHAVAYPRDEQPPKTLGEYVLGVARVHPGALLKITPDVDGINAFLRQMGSNTLLPAALDGRTFKITIPAVFNAWYEKKEGSGGINVYRAVPPHP